jgi:HAD superfamily hydrolase (TIGR01509 family)
MIKTILCDLGNVIVFVNHKNIAKGLAKYSNRDEDYIYHFFLDSILRKGFDTGKITPMQLFTYFKNNLNLTLDFNKFKKIWTSCFTGLNKDMEKLLDKLKKNYKLILLSNTDILHFTYCKKTYKILNVFDDFILSCEVGRRKPSPLIYLHALKKAKTFPSKIIYIDDIGRFVKAAKFFGIKGIQYKNMQKLRSDLKQKNVKI